MRDNSVFNLLPCVHSRYIIFSQPVLCWWMCGCFQTAVVVWYCYEQWFNKYPCTYILKYWCSYFYSISSWSGIARSNLTNVLCLTWIMRGPRGISCWSCAGLCWVAVALALTSLNQDVKKVAALDTIPKCLLGMVLLGSSMRALSTSLCCSHNPSPPSVATCVTHTNLQFPLDKKKVKI